MFPESLPDDIRSLSVADRIALASAIWDSIDVESSAPTLSDAQRNELDHRLEQRSSAPDAGEQWDDVRARLMAKE